MFDEESRRLNEETNARTNQVVAQLPLPFTGEEGIAALRKQWAKMPMVPRVVAERMEGRDSSWPGFDVRTLVVAEESAGRFAIYDVIVAPGAQLPAFHLPTADTYLCMTAGELELTVGDVTGTAHKDTFAYVPGDTTQALRNTSDKPARLFLWHSPAGPERAFAAAHALWRERGDVAASAFRDVLADFGFRFHERGERQPGDDLTNTATDRLEARIETLGDFMALREGWRRRRPIPKLDHDWSAAMDVYVPGQDTKVLLSGDEGGGQSVVFQYSLEPGYRAPSHYQPTEEEIFMVLEGTLDLTAGNITTDLQVGGIGFVPRYGTHAFSNPMKAGRTRTMTINSPAGHERAFVAAVSEMTAPDGPSAKLPEILVAHGWHFHQPAGDGDHDV